MHKRNADTRSNKTVGVGAEWSTTRQHETNTAAEEVANLTEECLIEDRRVKAPVLPFHLVSDEIVEKFFDCPTLSLHGVHNRFEDALQNKRN